jgi:hypothetical protein
MSKCARWCQTILTLGFLGAIVSCGIPSTGFNELWWVSYDADHALSFVRPAGLDGRYRRLANADSVYVSILGYMNPTRTSDSTFTCRLNAEISLENRSGSRANAQFDPRKMRVLVNAAPLHLAMPKVLTAGNRQKPSRFVYEWDGTMTFSSPKGTRRSPKIVIAFDTAVTLGGRVVPVDSIVATLAKPIAF